MKRITLNWVGGNGNYRKYDVVVYDGDVVIAAKRGVSERDAELFTNEQRKLYGIPCPDDTNYTQRKRNVQGFPGKETKYPTISPA